MRLTRAAGARAIPAPNSVRSRQGAQAGPSHRRTRSKKAAPQRSCLTLRQKLLITMALSVPVAVLTALFQDSIAQLGSWGYLGAFTISLTSSATIFFPAPGGAAVILMGTAFNPYLLGAASGVGSALGSLTAYILGRQTNLSQGRGLLPTVALRSMRLFGGPIIFLGNLIPVLPMDLAGLAAGAARYPVLRYLVYATMANMLKMTALILAASTSLEWIRAWLQTWLDLY